jgi:hypothetical protein
MTSEARDAKRFKLEQTAGVTVSKHDIIADMQRVASEHGAGVLSNRLYQAHGKYSHTTASKRFGSWNAALRVSGLRVLNEFEVPDEELFANIEHIWLGLGRQPRKREIVPPLSRYSESPYVRRFGSWRQSLEAFVQWAETANIGGLGQFVQPENRRRTPREPNSALRWRVANRDSFRCQHCGKSPALNTGVQLHIDHIVPWSKGGETVLENLQTLCLECNLGKGTQDQRQP